MGYRTAQRILERGNKLDSIPLKICSSSLAIRWNGTQNYFNILLYSQQSDHKQEYKWQIIYCHGYGERGNSHLYLMRVKEKYNPMKSNLSILRALE